MGMQLDRLKYKSKYNKKQINKETDSNRTKTLYGLQSNRKPHNRSDVGCESGHRALSLKEKLHLKQTLRSKNEQEEWVVGKTLSPNGRWQLLFCTAQITRKLRVRVDIRST